jgi:hypothetical protein
MSINTERDPNGTSPHAPGAKLDAGKVRVGLVFRGFARALLKVCEVGTFGARKYTEDGWLSVPQGIDRYDDAKGRHLLKGYIEPVDPDSQIEHLAHEAWNCLARLELVLREREALAHSLSHPAVKMTASTSESPRENSDASVQPA